MKVPFVNLKRQNEKIDAKIRSAIDNIIENTAFIGGKPLTEFEQNFAAYCGTKHAMGVSSGTDALFLALKACDIGTGDMVITVANTFIATSEAITMTGAKPAFVDVDCQTCNMDAKLLEQKLESMSPEQRKTVKAVIPVHLYGRPADMDKINAVAEKYNLKIVGDAAQAHGSTYKGKPIASLADITAFSFYPGKNMGAFGDAGAVVTDDDQLALKVQMLRNHGRTKKYEHDFEAYNCRMDALQAAILNVKLEVIDHWNNNRRKAADLYRELLADTGKVKPPVNGEDIKHVYHLFVIQTDNRDQLQASLKEMGVSSGIHYPIALHLQPAYAYLGHKRGDFPVSENLADNILSLPIDGSITEQEVAYVCECVKKSI